MNTNRGQELNDKGVKCRVLLFHKCKSFVSSYCAHGDHIKLLIRLHGISYNAENSGESVEGKHRCFPQL
jgi:hypothetical protein